MIGFDARSPKSVYNSLLSGFYFSPCTMIPDRESEDNENVLRTESYKKGNEGQPSLRRLKLSFHIGRAYCDRDCVVLLWIGKQYFLFDLY